MVFGDLNPTETFSAAVDVFIGGTENMKTL
jgi:hypothetical protein